jgi:hypothetical protein
VQTRLKINKKEMIGFRLRTDKLLLTFIPLICGAAYIIDGGCSDDGFEYFRCWLISRGKETFIKLKANPDSLITLVVENEVCMNLKDFGMWQSMPLK